MRPRKRVLIFCADEEQGVVLRYRMELMHPIRATVVRSKDGLVKALLDAEGWEGMVHVVSRNAANEHIAALMGAARGGAKRLEVRPETERELYGVSWSAADRGDGRMNPGATCHTIHTMMARKRGPKTKVGCTSPQTVPTQELSAVISSIGHH